MRIIDHCLHLPDGAPVTFKATQNRSSGLQPIYLVVHYTAGLSLHSATAWFTDPAASASAHLVIDRDGTVVQMVRFDERAWHAGESAWGALRDLNRYSIGIEVVNGGKLRRRSDGRWVTWSDTPVAPEDVGLARHKHESGEAGWHAYAAEQLGAVVHVATALHAAYGFTDILGHDDISPGRKVDPGPLFPLDALRSRVLGRK